MAFLFFIGIVYLVLVIDQRSMSLRCFGIALENLVHAQTNAYTHDSRGNEYASARGGDLSAFIFLQKKKEKKKKTKA